MPPRTGRPQARGGSRPGEAPPPKAMPDKFICYRCGKLYLRQKQNFPPTHSLIFRAANGYLPVCYTCFDELFRHYKAVLGDTQEAIKRMCLKFDMYWNKGMCESVMKDNGAPDKMRAYLSRLNLVHVVKKTFDDSIDEDMIAVFAQQEEQQNEEEEQSPPPIENDDDTVSRYIPEPSAQALEFWGVGFNPEFYFDLESRYERWTRGMQKPLDVAEEALYKQICLQEAKINRDLINGKDIEKGQNILNTLLGSLNAKPAQKQKDAESSSTADAHTPFGVWIRRFENERPVPEADPELRDKDKIIKYIDIWFRGHLSKMLGIKNSYSKLYEDEMAKLRVERPEYDGEEDDETLFNDIFGEE